jgi:hypothetical protein
MGVDNVERIETAGHPVIDAAGAEIKDVAVPSLPGDAVDKAYVDSLVLASAPTLTQIQTLFHSDAAAVDMCSITIATLTVVCLQDIETKLNAVITALDTQKIVIKNPT